MRLPLLLFTAETAAQKVQAAEDGWNTHHPERVAAGPRDPAAPTDPLPIR